MRRAAKKDNNHNEIKGVLEGLGAYVHDTHQLKNAFDFICCYRGKVYICEVKSEKGKLTEGESGCKEKVESSGCTYHILRNVEDALKMIGFYNTTATGSIKFKYI